MTSQIDTEQNTGPSFLSHIPAILWQWRRLIILTAIVGLIAATATAFVLRNTYRSNALLIVQSPQLSAGVTGDAAGEIVSRRIERIRQQIMSRPDLTALIKKYGLYGSEPTKNVPTAVVEVMRESITVEPVASNLVGGNANDQTISVRLSFDYSDPVKAQAIAQELMQKLIQLDASGNVQQANNTVEYLSDQAKALEQQMNEIAAKISQITGANGRVLANSGVTMLGGGSSGSYDVQIASLQRDNATLLAQKEASKAGDGRDPIVGAAEAQLAAVRAVYSENHPDVVQARQRLAEARQLAKANAARSIGASIDDQIAFNNSQIMALRSAKGQEQAQVSANISAMSRAPMVQQQVAQLQQQLAGLNQQYQTVSSRLLAAQSGVKVETQQVAERLSVAEAPIVPDKAESPNRPKIVALGLIGGIAFGLGIAFLFEIARSPIRSPATLAAITGIQPLGVVPYLQPLTDTKKGWALSPAAFFGSLRADIQNILGRFPR